MKLKKKTLVGKEVKYDCTLPNKSRTIFIFPKRWWIRDKRIRCSPWTVACWLDDVTWYSEEYWILLLQQTFTSRCVKGPEKALYRDTFSWIHGLFCIALEPCCAAQNLCWTILGKRKKPLWSSLAVNDKLQSRNGQDHHFTSYCGISFCPLQQWWLPFVWWFLEYQFVLTSKKNLRLRPLNISVRPRPRFRELLWNEFRCKLLTFYVFQFWG